MHFQWLKWKISLFESYDASVCFVHKLLNSTSKGLQLLTLKRRSYFKIVYYQPSHTNSLFKFGEHRSLETVVALGFAFRKKRITYYLLSESYFNFASKIPDESYNSFNMDELISWDSAMVKWRQGHCINFWYLNHFLEFTKSVYYDCDLREGPEC